MTSSLSTALAGASAGTLRSVAVHSIYGRDDRLASWLYHPNTGFHKQSYSPESGLIWWRSVCFKCLNRETCPCGEVGLTVRFQ